MAGESTRTFASTSAVGSPPDWTRVALPDGWPDRLQLWRPSHLLTLLRRVFSARRPVELPAGLPGAEMLPAYLRQEFHHLPNGNYSKRIVAGYTRSFDLLMLGRAHEGRREIARRLAGARRALDLGCGAGGLATALVDSGIAEVWGLDPSPYLLREAARRTRGVRLVQAIAEATTFSDAHFDAVGVCFLFHELPPSAGDRALDEIHRILAPGGRLVVAEPSPLQFRPRELMRFARRHGPLGLYFWLMALAVHEPFASAWHRRDVPNWLAAHGFALREDVVGMPLRILSAVRQAG